MCAHIYSEIFLYSGDYTFAGVLGVIQCRRYKRSHVLISLHYHAEIFRKDIRQVFSSSETLTCQSDGFPSKISLPLKRDCSSDFGGNNHPENIRNHSSANGCVLQLTVHGVFGRKQKADDMWQKLERASIFKN